MFVLVSAGLSRSLRTECTPEVPTAAVSIWWFCGGRFKWPLAQAVNGGPDLETSGGTTLQFSLLGRRSGPPYWFKPSIVHTFEFGS